MLKQLENLLRQQDSEQKRDTAEGLEDPAPTAKATAPAAPADTAAPAAQADVPGPDAAAEVPDPAAPADTTAPAAQAGVPDPAAPAEAAAPAAQAEVPGPDAAAEVPDPAAKPRAEAPSPTATVEVEGETAVDAPPDPPLEVGVHEVQGLQVETVPSEEDGHEIGGSEPPDEVPAGGGKSQLETPAQETPVPAPDSGNLVQTQVDSVEPETVEGKPIGFAPTKIEVVKEESIEVAPADVGAIEEPIDESPASEVSVSEASEAEPEPIEVEASGAQSVPRAEASEAEAIPAADTDDSESLAEGRRRFSLGDLLHLGNRNQDESVEEEATAPADADLDGGGEPGADSPPAESAEVSLDSSDVGEGLPTDREAAGPVPEQSEPAVAETGPASEEQPVDGEGVAEVGEVQTRSAMAGPTADRDAGVASDAVTEAPNEDDESAASKYPSWWFRGGSVHRYEEDAEGESAEVELDDEGRPVETPAETEKREKAPVEPFVQLEEVVEPPPVRKSISEQLAEDGEEPEPIAVAEDEDTEESDAPGGLAVGVEGLGAVEAASDSAVEGEPGLAEDPSQAVLDEPKAVAEAAENLAEEPAEDDLGAEKAAEEIDPAQALKIVESLADIAARRGSGAGGEVSPPDAPGQPEDEAARGDTAAPEEQLPAVRSAEDSDDVPQIPVIDVQVSGASADEEPESVDEPATVEIPAGEVPAEPRREADQAGEPTIATPAAKTTPARPDEKAPERPRRRLTARLGTLLLDAHLIAERDLERALKEHQVTGERLGYYLVDKGMVDEADLARVLADQYGVPAADLENAEIPAGVLGLISEKMARRYMVLPIAVSEGAIDVAMVDPADVNAIQDIEFATGLRAQPLIATEWAVERAIHRLYAPEAMRTALSGRSAKKSKLKDPRAIIRRIVRDRDEAVMQAEDDPHRAYELAASLDDFVDELLRVARKVQED
jgi:hypothetical protein